MAQRFLWLMKFSEKHKHLNLFCPKNGRAAIAFPLLIKDEIMGDYDSKGSLERRARGSKPTHSTNSRLFPAISIF